MAEAFFEEYMQPKWAAWFILGVWLINPRGAVRALRHHATTPPRHHATTPRRHHATLRTKHLAY